MLFSSPVSGHGAVADRCIFAMQFSVILTDLGPFDFDSSVL